MYLTVALVKTQFPPLLDAVTKGTVAEGRVTVWLTGASNLIDSYLGSRFDLPFATVPPIVTTLAYNFFQYFWQREIHLPTSTGKEVDWLFVRYKSDLKLLEQIRDGETALVDAAGDVIAPSAVKLATMQSNHQEVDQIFRQNKETWEQSLDENYDAEPTF